LPGKGKLGRPIIKIGFYILGKYAI